MPSYGSSGEMYGFPFLPDYFDVDILFPTGILININVNRNIPLSELKHNAWMEARLQPFGETLREPDQYMFCGVNMDGEEEIFYNETRRLCDLRLFQGVLKVVDLDGNKEENFLNSEISQCIGMSVYDLNKEVVDEEVLDFRCKLVAIAQYAYDEQCFNQRENILHYLYSAALCKNIIASVKNVLQNREFLTVYACLETNVEDRFVIQLRKMCTVKDCMLEIWKKCSPSSLRASKSSIGSVATTTSTGSFNPSEYVLKVCCTSAFMLDLQECLIHFEYIQNCLSKNRTPFLQLLPLRQVLTMYPEVRQPYPFILPTYATWRQQQTTTSIGPEDGNSVSLWNLTDVYKVGVRSCTYVNVTVKETCRLVVKMCLFHGLDPITTPLTSSEQPSNKPHWNEQMIFNIQLCDLPLGAKLCVAVVQRNTDKKNRLPDTCLGWANVDVFDYSRCLLTGPITLTLRPPTDMNAHAAERSDFLVPSKPSVRFRATAEKENKKGQTQILLEIADNYRATVRYPPHNVVLEHARALYERTETPKNALYNSNRQEIMKSIQEIVQRDPLCELPDQDKETLWRYRDVCRSREMADSLPRLIASLKWNVRNDVLLFYHLLHDWPDISEEVALQLLGHQYPDRQVRKFAVMQISSELTESGVENYLLQLVQCMKNESCLLNDLTEYLLTMSLRSSRLGLKFFWYLRAEIHDPGLRLRFGLILEAFCRGCGSFLSVLRKQSEVIDKLSCLNEYLKTVRDEEQVAQLHERLSQLDTLDTLQNFQSPLDHHCRFGALEVKMCDIKKSKKRPLWLVWKNPDPMAIKHISLYHMIFKMGDDLRQDILTLQLIRIIDLIWKDAGMDLHLIPYGCLATGAESGIIEAVREASTVMAIQKGKLASAIQIAHSQLHKWLQTNNPTAEEYNIAIDNFTRSCAGYCVATFVLGIRDRHPDNIMLNRRGQLFHIDFGHFLNNRKKKFGINRERVPFVLTLDFVNVISRGASRPYATQEFTNFSNLCIRAYLSLREHSHFFLTLFSLMVTCGLPELSTLSDLEYLRKTLALEKTSAEANAFFQAQFAEACTYAWQTKLDWFSHWVNT